MRRSGFTLVELCVALVIGSLVVLLAHRTFAATAETGRTLRAVREAIDRERNGVRWLRAAIGSLDVGEAGAFLGRPDRATFSAWLQTPGLWLERERVTLALEGGHVVARGARGPAPTLATGVDSLAFDYLLAPGASAVWVREWSSPISAPFAVCVRLARASRTDTLLFLVGPRG